MLGAALDPLARRYPRRDRPELGRQPERVEAEGEQHVISTRADVSELEQAVGFHPSVTIGEGIARFVTWYKDYFQVP